MNIEENIFKRYNPDFDKLLQYGFTKENNTFLFEKFFMNNEFKAVIEITFDGKVSGTVFDLENNEEFLPLRVENNQGAFTGEVRTAYEGVLQDICSKLYIISRVHTVRLELKHRDRRWHNYQKNWHNY